MIKRPNPLTGIKNYVRTRAPSIQDVVRETTSGGIVFRHNPVNNELEILLVQDARDRWTIPKGHVEEGESTQDTARREIREETGLQDITMLNWLGKTNFKYRRESSLVLMVTHVYIAYANNPDEKLVAEEWMNGIRWFSVATAQEKIAYEQIHKLMKVGVQKMIKMDVPRKDT
jgi:ADP-ribose pyrophosphatase YjhB (NUDIX family)